MNKMSKEIFDSIPELKSGLHKSGMPAISPIFIFLAATMIITAYLAYNNFAGAPFWIFLFVTSGWIVSLSLHEFGHAYTAYISGDKSVAEKGYLNLNPLKYTNVFMSIILPIVFLMMGGIGFPGGAVYINYNAIKSTAARSMVSAAGPMFTALFALVLLLPFFIGLDKTASIEQNAFWSGMALLTPLCYLIYCRFRGWMDLGLSNRFCLKI